MQVNGHVMAMLDCLACFANNALHFNYKKPVVHEGHVLDLKDSRHPVIERIFRWENLISLMIFISIRKRNRSSFSLVRI